MNYESRPVVADLRFGEGPRWHDGELWFSDMHDHVVLRTALDGRKALVANVPEDRPSGLGWLPDGRLLIVAMESRRLYRVERDGSLAEHADVSGVARGSLNDMIVAKDGSAYIGDMGNRMSAMGEWHPGQIIRVAADGEVSVVADDLSAPNGLVLTQDQRTLIVAESGAARVSAFAVDPGGALAERRLFAELDPLDDGEWVVPDGICLDAEGAIWVAELMSRRLRRVKEGGEVLDTTSFDDAVPIACVLGGQDRRTLLVCVASDYRREVVERERSGRIVAIRVAVPGAGSP